jgi:hypothetical protein
MTTEMTIEEARKIADAACLKWLEYADDSSVRRR